MRIRLRNGPCSGEHDVRIAESAAPPEEYLVLVETGPRTPTDGLNGGSIPGINVYAVHRLDRGIPTARRSTGSPASATSAGTERAPGGPR